MRSNPDLHTSLKKPWCFIASAVFGPDANETQALRRFRDEILRTTIVGRVVIRAYYKLSPGLSEWLMNKKKCAAVVREFLRPIVFLADTTVKLRGEKWRKN